MTPPVRPFIFNYMVEHDSVDLDRAFQALANRTRRKLIERLAEGEATVTELAEPFDMSLAAVSKHLAVLESAGLVRRRVQGREHHLSLDGTPMGAIQAWMIDYRRFWAHSLDALAGLVEEDEDR